MTDTGPGIPPEKLTTIFDKYQQAACCGFVQNEGHGIGFVDRETRYLLPRRQNMGRKQTRRRKYLYFCLAGLIFLVLSGCAAPEKMKDRNKTPGEADQHLLRGRELLAQKDFEGALSEYQEIFSLATHQPPEDEALYTIGMIYVHPENPKRDPTKSLYYFNRVTEDYPQSLWAFQAKAWIGMLQENGRLNQSVENLNRRVKQLQLEKTNSSEEKRKPRRGERGPSAPSQQPGTSFSRENMRKPQRDPEDPRSIASPPSRRTRPSFKWD